MNVVFCQPETYKQFIIVNHVIVSFPCTGCYGLVMCSTLDWRSEFNYSGTVEAIHSYITKIYIAPLQRDTQKCSQVPTPSRQENRFELYKKCLSGFWEVIREPRKGHSRLREGPSTKLLCGGTDKENLKQTLFTERRKQCP